MNPNTTAQRVQSFCTTDEYFRRINLVDKQKQTQPSLQMNNQKSYPQPYQLPHCYPAQGLKDYQEKQEQMAGQCVTDSRPTGVLQHHIQELHQTIAATHKAIYDLKERLGPVTCPESPVNEETESAGPNIIPLVDEIQQLTRLNTSNNLELTSIIKRLAI